MNIFEWQRNFNLLLNIKQITDYTRSAKFLQHCITSGIVVCTLLTMAWQIYQFEWFFSAHGRTVNTAGKLTNAIYARQCVPILHMN